MIKKNGPQERQLGPASCLPYAGGAAWTLGSQRPRMVHMMWTTRMVVAIMQSQQGNTSEGSMSSHPSSLECADHWDKSTGRDKCALEIARCSAAVKSYSLCAALGRST